MQGALLTVDVGVVDQVPQLEVSVGAGSDDKRGALVSGVVRGLELEGVNRLFVRGDHTRVQLIPERWKAIDDEDVKVNYCR